MTVIKPCIIIMLPKAFKHNNSLTVTTMNLKAPDSEPFMMMVSTHTCMCGYEATCISGLCLVIANFPHSVHVCINAPVLTFLSYPCVHVHLLLVISGGFPMTTSFDNVQVHH